MENQTFENKKQLTTKQKKIIWLTAFTVTFVTVLLIVLFSIRGCSVKKLEISNVNMSTSYNYGHYTVEINGIAENVSGRNLSLAAVEYSVYDSSGNNLGTAIDTISNLRKDETWRFKAIFISTVAPSSCKLAGITVT